MDKGDFMNKLIIAQSDLGVNIDGASEGAKVLADSLNYQKYVVSNKNIKKDYNDKNLRKNEREINKTTKKIFNLAKSILNNNEFPILIGGDHSVAIGSALASQEFYKNIGIIWIDAHGDFNTFETTPSGNIHGMPLAAITGYKCNELTDFITNNYVDPKKCVILGARDIDEGEYINIKDSGVTIISQDDIENIGINNALEKAIEIASDNTNKIHISFDLDVIDPKFVSGVTTKVPNGISDQDSYFIIQKLKYIKDKISSFDLVEYNSLNDTNENSKKIALKILEIFLSK